MTIRSTLLGIVLLLALFSQSGCSEPTASTNSQSERISQLESQLEDVRSKLSDAESKVAEVSSAVDELSSTLISADQDDWQYALITALNTIGDLESDTQELASLIDDAASAAN